MPFARFDDLEQVVISPQYSAARGGTVYGETIEVGLYSYPRGQGAAPHSHPQEQVVHVVQGRILWRIGSEEREIGPGDVVLIPAGVEHQATPLTDATIISCKNRLR